jgi:NADPH:quinone reductase-like Zn-dependent oxidoreductase
MESTQKYQAILTDRTAPYFEEVEGRKLEQDEVLIKVLAAPINPSDTSFAVGQYGIPSLMNKPPLGVGAEGAGVIVDVRAKF